MELQLEAAFSRFVLTTWINEPSTLDLKTLSLTSWKSQVECLKFLLWVPCYSVFSWMTSLNHWSLVIPTFCGWFETLSYCKDKRGDKIRLECYLELRWHQMNLAPNKCYKLVFRGTNTEYNVGYHFRGPRRCERPGRYCRKKQNSSGSPTLTKIWKNPITFCSPSGKTSPTMIKPTSKWSSTSR